MPMRRSSSLITSRSGVNYVCSLVERHGCSFQENAQYNDVGTDAYIEFFIDGIATGCCIAVQIKSGESFTSQSTDLFTLRANHNHFAYWKDHILPVAGIVYNPETDQARWIDITESLSNHPHLVEDGPYTLQLPAEQVLDDYTFDAFIKHFQPYRELYTQEAKFGAALARFSHREDPVACLDGFRALYSFHRKRIESWNYIFSCFRYFRGHRLLPFIISQLSLIPGHPDVLWHKDNIMEDDVLRVASELMSGLLLRDDVFVLMEMTSQNGGYQRGCIGQACVAIIGKIKQRCEYLESIAFDASVDKVIRYFSIMLLVFFLQNTSIERCQQLIRRYKETFPDCEEDVGGLTMMSDDLAKWGYFSLYY